MAFVFYDVFSMLCKKKGESESKAVEGNDVQLNRSAVVKWKKGSTPEMATIQKLAAHFSVSTDYLIGTDSAAQLDVALFKVQDSLRLWGAKLDFAENEEQRAEAEKEIKQLTKEQERLKAEISESKKAPAQEGERKPDIEELKLALFGGDGEVTDEMWEEALFAAEMIKARYKRKKAQDE
ncbi:hypothetical protein D7X94_00315 [Acutalibacter sp. 1XD8-33]|uniref:hypothetical protein n=1 Tax=Acutalibacter sp. 1XD8-33 TaxID=2320081 RepID=UPI000EA1EB93|nr:hypothetical protein [Acutalibacter sp. 1XD8-33]RKJ41960.1 hypothetical protein D7X94_00315 [Acutalibacter sp. 1XD8-33]